MRLFRRCFTVAMILVGGLGVCSVGRAADRRAVPGKESAASAKLYAFCMEIHDAKKRTLPEQATMLRQLGYDGVGYPLWLGEDFDRNLRTLDAVGVPVYVFYTYVKVKPGVDSFDARVPEAIGKLKGRPVTICVLLSGLPPADPQGEEKAIKTLRQLGDLAAAAGVRISIYHHTGDWSASLLHALDIAKKVNHPAVGVNFNLCHWLKVDGDKDYRPVLRDNASRIFAVTINGAKVGSTTWTDGLIQPLDQGDFDNAELLRVLREVGYRGPIGLMCFGIAGDAQEHLARSLKVWKAWQSGR